MLSIKPTPRLAPAPSILVLGGILFACLAQELTPPPGTPDTRTDPGFVPVFNGQDLTGWDGDEGLWSVQDGAIVGQTSDTTPIAYNKFLVWADGELDDFELKLEYRIESGNSGIQVRSFLREGKDAEGKPLSHSVAGYQADLDAARGWTGANYGEGFGGVLAKRGESVVLRMAAPPAPPAAAAQPASAPPPAQPAKPQLAREVKVFGDGEALKAIIREKDWNEFHIIAQGNHIQHRVNGTLMCEVTDERPEARAKGILALQLHKGPAMKVEFRNIQLKRLPLSSGRKKVVFVAGRPSHGPGQHEHNAGCLLLASHLERSLEGKVLTQVYRNGWPADLTALQNADALVLYSDGAARHVAFWHRRQLNILRDRGIGLGAIHYATEMQPDQSNQDLLSWTGGAFEVNHSVNPHWDASFTTLPDHPAARGVSPFTLRDEWYFNLRFASAGLTPILAAVPPASTMSRPDGHHSGNPAARQAVTDGVCQTLCWVYDRPDGGRGFGTTGGHFHANWKDDNFRRTVLNAIAWIAKAEIPAGGLQTLSPSEAEMQANLDPK